MNGDNNNSPDPLNVNSDTIIDLLLSLIGRLCQLRNRRLQSLINRLQPLQLNDPMRRELPLKTEMDSDENLITRVLKSAYTFRKDKELEPGERTNIMETFTDMVRLINEL